jgi:ribosome-associated toxin RatA of RatAB toxin-antitoxin module
MPHRESRTVSVNAPAAEVLTFLRDIDNQHTWFPSNSVSEILERHEDGLVAKAHLVNDVIVAKDGFTLDYTHGPDWMHWVLKQPTRVQRSQQGTWTVVDSDNGCEATMELELDAGIPLPGLVQRKVVRDTVKNATNALAKHFA